MEAHAHPFAFLLLGWSCGFFGTLVICIVVRAIFPTREIEQAFH
jgi:hypothetical protein